MKTPFQTWVSYPIGGSSAGQVADEIERQVASALRDLDSIRVVVIKSGGFLGNVEEVIPAGSILELHAPSGDARWGKFYPRGTGWFGNPPHLTGHLLGLFEWWHGSFTQGPSFMSPEAQKAYRELLDAIVRMERIVRVVDGNGISSFESEGHARFVYYRDPIAFVKSFLMLRDLEGDPEAIVPVLKALAEKDTLTEKHYSENDARYGDPGSPVKTARLLESDPSGPGRVRRLRFTTPGGVILERGRFAVGDPLYYIGTQDDPQRALEAELLSSGLVRSRTDVQTSASAA